MLHVAISWGATPSPLVVNNNKQQQLQQQGEQQA